MTINVFSFGDKILITESLIREVSYTSTSYDVYKIATRV